MGEEDKDIESRATKLIKAPFGFLRRRAFAIGLGAAIGAAYLWLTGQEQLDLEGFKKSISDWGTWRDILIGASILAGATAGGTHLANRARKKKGKKPIRLLKLLKGMVSPHGLGRGEKGFMELIDALPDSSMVYFALGTFYSGKGRFIEAMESYYSALRMRDMEIMPKIPLIGPHNYRGFAKGKIEELRKKLEQDPKNTNALLNLAMRYFLLNDFDNAIEHFEQIDKAHDPIALHVLASRLYSEISKRADRPKVRMLSFGDSRAGRLADKAVYFWDRRRHDKDEMRKKAEHEALAAVRKILKIDGIEQMLEPVGDYKVYRIPLNKFVKGFAVLNEGEREKLEKKFEHGKTFERLAAGGRFRSAHHVGIVEHEGKHYLVVFYEDGAPLAFSTNPRHYRMAMRFAAKSDALMPTDKVINPDYDPRRHFYDERLPQLGDSARMHIGENSDFLFKYSGAFPVVFDGDWHPFNCLVDEDENIIGLDKEGKGVTIGPVTAARVANQGGRLKGAPQMLDELKDSLVAGSYIPVYHDFCRGGMRIHDAELFLAQMQAATMEKAITAHIFNAGKPTMEEPTMIFLRNAIHAGQRIRYEFRRFYSDAERRQCRHLEEAIHRHLLS